MSLAAQHSRASRAWLAHLPGLESVMPATPYDVKGAIIAAVRDDNPVFVIMNKMSLAMMGEVPEEPYAIADRQGDDRAPRHELHDRRDSGACCTRP